jgi:hypothetical protein
MVTAIRQGSVGQVIASVPAADRGVVGGALRSSFAAALNELLFVTAGLAFVGAVCAVVLIRRKDFHQPGGADAATASATRTPVQEAV